MMLDMLDDLYRELEVVNDIIAPLEAHLESASVDEHIIRVEQDGVEVQRFTHLTDLLTWTHIVDTLARAA
jgi:hypothetical protein